MHARLEANLLRWPSDLGEPVNPLDNWRIYQAQGAMTRNGRVPTFAEARAMTEAEGRQYEREQMMDGPSELVVSYADRRGI